MAGLGDVVYSAAKELLEALNYVPSFAEGGTQESRKAIRNAASNSPVTPQRDTFLGVGQTHRHIGHESYIDVTRVG